MKEKVTFIKIQDSWYANIPEYLEQGGLFSDCLMVAGAPELIEKLGGEITLTVTVSDKWIDGYHAALMKDYVTNTSEESESSNWSYYVALIFPRRITKDPTSPFTETLNVGLCPVNAWVFGGSHPDTIFIKIDRDEKEDK
jgi:hypothetical protein